MLDNQMQNDIKLMSVFIFVTWVPLSTTILYKLISTYKYAGLYVFRYFRYIMLVSPEKPKHI